MAALSIVFHMLFLILTFNTEFSKGHQECYIPETFTPIGKEETYQYDWRTQKKFTIKEVKISLKTDSLPPWLDIEQTFNDGVDQTTSISCIAFNDLKRPRYSASDIPIRITVQRIYLEGEVFTSSSIPRQIFSRGKPTLNFTCQDLVQLGDLDGNRFISLKAFNVVIPPPVVEIYNINGIKVESYLLDQLVTAFGSTTLRLPGHMGCQSFLVKVCCNSVELLGKDQSKWYFLPSPSENNSLLIPAIDPPTLLISSTKPTHSKQDPFSDLDYVRIENIGPDEKSTSNTSDLRICSQENCSKDRKEGQLYDLRFKTVAKSPNGELWESCFTSVPPQKMPQLTFTLTFKNSVIVNFKNLSDVIERNATFLKESVTPETSSERIVSIEFVPSNQYLLCPSEISKEPEAEIGSIGIRWSQESFIYERLALQVIGENVISSGRSGWCVFNESSSLIHWKFAGVDDSCNVEFAIRYQKDDGQQSMTIKTRGSYEKANLTFHFGLHLGTVFPAGQPRDGVLIFRISSADNMVEEFSCSLIHNFTGPNRSMVSSSSNSNLPEDFSGGNSKTVARNSTSPKTNVTKMAADPSTASTSEPRSLALSITSTLAATTPTASSTTFLTSLLTLESSSTTSLTSSTASPAPPTTSETVANTASEAPPIEHPQLARLHKQLDLLHQRLRNNSGKNTESRPSTSTLDSTTSSSNQEESLKVSVQLNELHNMIKSMKMNQSPTGVEHQQHRSPETYITAGHQTSVVILLAVLILMVGGISLFLFFRRFRRHHRKDVNSLSTNSVATTHVTLDHDESLNLFNFEHDEGDNSRL